VDSQKLSHHRCLGNATFCRYLGNAKFPKDDMQWERTGCSTKNGTQEKSITLATAAVRHSRSSAT